MSQEHANSFRLILHVAKSNVTKQINQGIFEEIHRDLLTKIYFRAYILMYSIYKRFIKISCTTIHRYPIFSTRYSVMCNVYTSYCGTSEIEHGLCACTVDNPLAKARGLSLRAGAKTMLYLPLVNAIH